MARRFGLSVPPVLILVLVALAAAVLFLVSHQETEAGGVANSFKVNPASKDIGVASSTSVQLVADPGVNSLSVWVLEMAYDPSVVTFNSCTSAPSQPGAANVTACEAKDAGGSPEDDTVVSVGAFLFTDTARGLDEETTLATAKFDAVGAVGDCTDLKITVTADLGPDPDVAQPVPVVTDGKLCIVESAGVDRKWGDADCNDKVLPRDGQALLRKLLSQPPLSTTPPCLAISQAITVAGKSGTKWADWDCNGTVLPRDGQALLRNLLSQPPLSQTGDCPGIGDLVQVSD